MEYELTDTQRSLAESLAASCMAACQLEGVPCKGAKPKNFYTTVIRYAHRVPRMTVELERCITWCAVKHKHMSALRFKNWIINYLDYAKRDQLHKQEKKELQNGNEFQRADYQRRFGKKAEKTQEVDDEYSETKEFDA